MHKKHKTPVSTQKSDILSSRFSLAAIILTIIGSTVIAIVTRNNNEIIPVSTTTPLVVPPQSDASQELGTKAPTDPIVLTALYTAGSMEMIILTHYFGTKILRLNDIQADYLAGIVCLFLVVFYFIYVMDKKENATPAFVKFIQLFASLGVVTFLYNFGMVFMRHRRDQAKKLKRATAEMSRKLKGLNISVVIPEGERKTLNETEEAMRLHAQPTRSTNSTINEGLFSSSREK